MRLVLSRHALEQSRARGVSIEEIRKTIQRGAKHFQGQNIVSDFMHIKVVYKVVHEAYFVLTVMIRIR